MWIILINGKDTGYSISGHNYFDALNAAVGFVMDAKLFNTNDVIDVQHWD